LIAVAPDPMALNHRPAGWDWRLLILGRESVAADLELQGFQNMERLAFRRKRLAKLPTMRMSIPKRDGLLGFRNRRKAEELPFTGLAQQKPVRSSMWTRCITIAIAPVRLSSRRESSVFASH
jgi:hypothetical protein